MNWFLRGGFPRCNWLLKTHNYPGSSKTPFKFPASISNNPGPHLVPVQRPIDRIFASHLRHFSGGALKKAQGKPPHRDGCTATPTVTQAQHPGKHTQPYQSTIINNGSSSSSNDTKMGENVEETTPFPLTEVDKWVLSQTDQEFKCHDWEELREILATNQLHLLKRKPSDLRRYIKWSAETKAEYGSTTNFLLNHRLPKAWGEPPFIPVSNIPFADPSDHCVLKNDWPYGFEPGISHIVVWTRTPIATDETVGDMTPESRTIVSDFIKRFFVDRLGPGGEDKVLWFKNWVALQSVRTVDHVHVLVRDVEPEIIEEWTRELECHRAH
ncbi:hypothetical protein QBC44DRAFT_318807 [Cladorrhinum sp. PSN332]|nr:hypothetical protein QBC44DRAFT_318807 [Cladorrhinum sp. PSN332]